MERDVEDQLNEWRDSENAAEELEAQLQSLGQGASDPRVADLHRRAAELRQKADGMLAEIVRAVREAGPGA